MRRNNCIRKAHLVSKQVATVIKFMVPHDQYAGGNSFQF